MFRDRDFKKNIYGGVISSAVFLILFQPLLGFIWKLVTKISLNTYTGYIDRIYRLAATGKTDWYSHNIQSYVAVLILVLTQIYVGNGLLAIREVVRMEKVDALPSLEARKAYLEDKQYLISKFARLIIKYFKAFSIFYIAFIVFVAGVMFDLVFTANSIFKITTSFNQRITVLGPHMDVQMEEEFRAKWALMKSRKDFEEIDLEIEKFANSKGVKLPENILK